MIPFNKPYLTGNETVYITKAVESGKISGNGLYTKQCHDFFENEFSFRKCLLTTSCTDALEMAAILVNIQPGDEVILPAYTFVSTANAFVLRGAKLIFVDSQKNHPNIDANEIEKLITAKTKVIVPVHYAGVACDMGKIMELANKYNLFVVEDAAQAIDSYYKGKPLGSIGHLAAFSFHETKNIISGEGGMLVINDSSMMERAEIIWEKGTNRSAFFKGEVDKYGWVDIGSSFLPSEIVAAFLFAQLENLGFIQNKRKQLVNLYEKKLLELEEYNVGLPTIMDYASNNAHMFYLICNSSEERTELISYLKANGVHAVFHYLGLHKSEFYKSLYSGKNLPNSDEFEKRLVRLPLYFELSEKDIDIICQAVLQFYARI